MSEDRTTANDGYSNQWTGLLMQDGLPSTTADATVRLDQMAMGKVAFTCGICGRHQTIDMWLWDNMPICEPCRIILRKLIVQERIAEDTRSWRAGGW